MGVSVPMESQTGSDLKLGRRKTEYKEEAFPAESRKRSAFIAKQAGTAIKGLAVRATPEAIYVAMNFGAGGVICCGIQVISSSSYGRILHHS